MIIVSACHYRMPSVANSDNQKQYSELCIYVTESFLRNLDTRIYMYQIPSYSWTK